MSIKERAKNRHKIRTGIREREEEAGEEEEVKETQ